jgi:PKD repeat protein
MSNSRATILLMMLAALAACGGNDDGHSVPSNRVPVARVTVSPTVGPAPLVVAVSGAASTDADGTINAYSWHFGDGTSAVGVAAEHTYTAVGEFVITLTVTDNRGASASIRANVVATGSTAVYNGSVYDGSKFEDEPASGTLDVTPLQ